VRIPKVFLQKYGLADSLVLEETDRGILLLPPDKAAQLRKLITDMYGE
jgi:hypothetical protein